MCIAVQAERFVNSCLSGACSTKLPIFYQQPGGGKVGSEIMNTHLCNGILSPALGFSPQYNFPMSEDKIALSL